MADELPPAPPPTPPADPPKTVALEHFQNVVEAKKGLEAQVATLKGQVQSLTEKASTVDVLTGQVNEWKTKAEKAESRFGVYTEFSGALGVTNTKVINTFDAEYGSLPDTDRPTRKAWVDTLKAKPEEAPEHLRPWLAPAVTPVAGRPPQPRPPGTPPTPPSAPAQFSADEVRAAREALARGDSSKWREMRKAMGLK